MNLVLQRSRQILFALLFLVCITWAWAEAAQHLLRQRAERLLTEIRSLQPNRSTWSDAQSILQKWAQWSSAKATCTPEACTVQIDLVQALPPILVGSPNAGARTLLPRLIDHSGLRTAAARAGLTIEHGVVTSRWFGEQVTLPVRDWSASDNYIPYLSVSSAASAHFHEIAGDEKLLHPNRMVQHKESYLAVTISPEEDPSEQAALMDFGLACFTQLRPCETAGEILPEGQRLLDEQELTPPTR
jgi:hypothetical protein